MLKDRQWLNAAGGEHAKVIDSVATDRCLQQARRWRQYPRIRAARRDSPSIILHLSDAHSCLSPIKHILFSTHPTVTVAEAVYISALSTAQASHLWLKPLTHKPEFKNRCQTVLAQFSGIYVTLYHVTVFFTTAVSWTEWNARFPSVVSSGLEK